MILLDTNIVSEALKAGGDPAVLAWLDEQAIETLYLSTITIAEIHFGIALLPAGKRRTSLARNFEERVVPQFDGRLLPFDIRAAHAYGTLRAEARRAGKAIAVADGYIAAIAVAHGLAIATRDVSPFETASLRVIRP